MTVKRWFKETYGGTFKVNKLLFIFLVISFIDDLIANIIRIFR